MKFQKTNSNQLPFESMDGACCTCVRWIGNRLWNAMGGQTTPTDGLTSTNGDTSELQIHHLCELGKGSAFIVLPMS